MACEAKRLRGSECGWVCDGTGLVQLLDAGNTIPPAVIREDLIPYLDEASASFLPARPFPGGDHVHLVIQVPLRVPLVGESA